ncbi:exopolysaccharide biosynthesis polyprenyl glycosylphosphotransferase [Altericroceibacterium spongiae]|uniref:Exopolysaccharide biosynthesis polyprenyl glycosylphosphotransferase n=2 Tax=Altericroceibacterium spongiae TaxID=2320269 RepID=A0A420EJC3_9SPHN|nr:exopolysaccharide biosynthesis polyprenyl glycosylphosphotransferase [Altericroceibacterium spongiae]
MNAPTNNFTIGLKSPRPLAPSFERRRLQIYLLLMVGDIGSLLIGFVLAGLAYFGDLPSSMALFEMQLFLPLYLTLAFYQRVYSIEALESRNFAIRRLILSMALSAALLVFVVFYTKSAEDFSRAVYALGLVFSLMLMIALRFCMFSFLHRFIGPTALNVLVIDDGGPAVKLDHAYRLNAEEHQLHDFKQNPGALDRLGRYVANMDRVIVSCPLAQREEWSFVLRAAGINGELVSESLHELGAIGLHREQHFTSLAIAAGPLDLRARILKRLFDLAIAIPALICLSPLMIIAALAVKLESEGPVFFVQRRLGRGNRFFPMFKFRSMRAAESDADGTRSAAKDDDRITRVGRILRKTSVDELPQLLNVLRGDMSIVGPRPHALGSQAGTKLFWEVDVAYWHRHSLKPGLTGLAQVRGFRGATDRERDLQDRLQSDLEYIANWNLPGDILILFRTLAVVVHDRAF